jgi:ATP-binding cassette, subfamily C, bacterial
MQYPTANYGSMLQVLRIFFNAERTKPWAVLICLVIASMLEAIGISSLLPVANSILGQSGDNDAISRVSQTVLAFFGYGVGLAPLLVLVSLTMALRSLLLFAAMSYAGWTTARVITNLRQRLIKAVFDARWSFYSSQSSGDMASTVSSDAQRAGDAYSVSALVAAYAVQIVGYAVLAMFLNWRAALAGIGAGVLIMIGSRTLIRITRNAGFKVSERTGLVTEDMLDLLKNIKPLKAMNRYDGAISDLNVRLKKLRKSLFKIVLARSGLQYGTDTALVLVLAFAAYGSVAFGKASLSELTVLGILFFQIVNYTNKLQKQYQTASALIGSHERVMSLISEAESQAEVNSGTVEPVIGTGISFNNVSFAHGDLPVLQNVDLEIPVQKITVLTGPSGSGKTTIIDLFTALHRPQAGEIRIGTTSLGEVNIKAWRDKIGYVAQDLILFHDTIRNNVSLGEVAVTDEAIRTALQKAGALSFVEAMPQGLDTDVGEHGGKLSGGQRQRIALARALLGEPEILILDEVTSALDPESEAEIIRNIAGLRAQYTIVAITHRPAWKDIADRLYLVSGGRVARER